MVLHESISLMISFMILMIERVYVKSICFFFVQYKDIWIKLESRFELIVPELLSLSSWTFTFDNLKMDSLLDNSTFCRIVMMFEGIGEAWEI